EMAGEEWSFTAWAALIRLFAQEEDASIGVQLLGDIKGVFERKNQDRLTTEEILQDLITIQGAPWALIWADDLRCGSIPKAAAKLARMLKHYKRADGERLKPRTIRVGNDTPRGFHRSDFEDAWNRYLPSSSENAATVATSATHDRGSVAAVADVAASAYIGDEDEGGLDL